MFFYSEQSGPIVDPYAANVSLLLKGDGTNNSTSFVDSSTNNFAISRLGNTVISTDQSKFGGSSIYFPSSSDLYLADNNAFTFDGDFTIEVWVYLTNTNGYRSIINHWNNGSSFSFRVDYGKTYLAYSIAGNDIGIQGTSNTVLANTWTHIAVTRAGNTVRFFVNGVQDSSVFTNVAGAFGNSNNVVDIGGLSVNGNLASLNSSYAFLGYMDDLRVTKGVARYAANFTPPGAL